MKKKICSFIICALLIAPVFSQGVHKVFFKPIHKDQTWTVPAGVTQIKVKLWGAGGAGGGDIMPDDGGGGGFASATLNVKPGEIFTIIVGEGGLPGAGMGAYGGGGGKQNGKGGRGGGRSAIRNETGEEFITAGGGGGGGESPYPGPYPTIARGGGGGGPTGNPSTWVPFDGEPGTQSAGGAAGRNPNCCTAGGNPGSQFLGGYAGRYDNGFNGSGGGGYYGGGSGTDYGDGGGGGGSSYIPTGGTTISASLTDSTPGNITDPDYRWPAGYGGPRTKEGKCGLVVIIYSDKNSISSVQNENQLLITDESSTNNKIIAYPNPAKNSVTVNYTAAKNGQYLFEITDIGGRILLHQNVNATQGTNHTTIDVSRFAKGSYFINIIRPDKTKESIQVSKE